MDNNILNEKELSNSAYSHIIHVPIEKVDIAPVWRWGMRIGNVEMFWRRLRPAHPDSAS